MALTSGARLIAAGSGQSGPASFSQSGLTGDAGIPGGQVTVGWDDFGTNQNQIMANTIAPGRNYSFDGPSGLITPWDHAGTGGDEFHSRRSRFPAAAISSLDSLSLTRLPSPTRISPRWAWY